MKFDPLFLSPQWLQEYHTKYPNGMSVLENIIEWLNKVNELIEWANITPEKVSQILDEWLASGKLEMIINEINTNKVSDLAYNVRRDFGAIGDGQSHPLSTKYTTLAEAQAFYPFATSLTQEIDWCAFTKMFKAAALTNKKCYIPVGDYHIISPLDPIGRYTINSTEYGNFEIEGESYKNTVLTFNLTDNVQVAFPLFGESSGWTIKKFRLVNLTYKVGTGFKFDRIYNSNISDLQAIYFNIGFDISSYISDFTNLTGTNGVCGFYIRNCTSTNFKSCYGASNSPAAGTEPYEGCGFFITNPVYTNFISCASDSNTIAYKIKHATLYNIRSTTMSFIDCGCEECGKGWEVDSPGVQVTLSNPSAFQLTNDILVDIIRATKVVISNFSDATMDAYQLSAYVGPGVVSMDNSGINTAGNPSLYPTRSKQLDQSKISVDDASFTGFNLGANTFINGLMITRANSLEFEIYGRTNGDVFAAQIDILPTFNNTGVTLDRGGTVYVGGRNAGGGVILLNESKTNAGIVVTQTKIKDGSSNDIGVRVTIEPFSGTANALTNDAIFKLDAYFKSVGADFQGKNHNIKELTTYTGRVNFRLKGVDY